MNGDKQICIDGKNVQTWPPTQNPASDDYFDEITTRRRPQETSTTEKYRTTTTRTTKVGKFTTTSSPISSLVESCGEIKKMDMYSSEMLPAVPGQFPWAVAIYRNLDDGHDTYKCAGTIIDKKKILTSVNCLLEDGLLLKPGDLRVYVSPFSLSTKIQNYKIFEIADILIHEEFNQQLENNIAVVKLNRDIEFGDYVQPICLPGQTYTAKGKIGKVRSLKRS